MKKKRGTVKIGYARGDEEEDAASALPATGKAAPLMPSASVHVIAKEASRLDDLVSDVAEAQAVSAAEAAEAETRAAADAVAAVEAFESAEREATLAAEAAAEARAVAEKDTRGKTEKAAAIAPAAARATSSLFSGVSFKQQTLPTVSASPVAWSPPATHVPETALLLPATLKVTSPPITMVPPRTPPPPIPSAPPSADSVITALLVPSAPASADVTLPGVPSANRSVPSAPLEPSAPSQSAQLAALVEDFNSALQSECHRLEQLHANAAMKRAARLTLESALSDASQV